MVPLGAHRDWGQAMLGLFRAFVRDKRGATAIEYGLICALICVAIMGAVQFAATRTVTMWNNVATKVTNT
jgi:pilus assembly protein Flp/PilA